MYLRKVYRENTTLRTRKSTTHIFIQRGGYGAFAPAMLVYASIVVLGLIFFFELPGICSKSGPLRVIFLGNQLGEIEPCG